MSECADHLREPPRRPMPRPHGARAQPVQVPCLAYQRRDGVFAVHARRTSVVLGELPVEAKHVLLERPLPRPAALAARVGTRHHVIVAPRGRASFAVPARLVAARRLRHRVVHADRGERDGVGEEMVPPGARVAARARHLPPRIGRISAARAVAEEELAGQQLSLARGSRHVGATAPEVAGAERLARLDGAKRDVAAVPRVPRARETHVRVA
mmetsp:Transcript_37932/g.94661  ORF Transcript_37932/g.94661 Transcript_37932/m.94661 type:complete len:212 (-) Transcript_37932:249-884(-)|eukprot:4425053-Prymnesium_polylepis.1